MKIFPCCSPNEIYAVASINVPHLSVLVLILLPRDVIHSADYAIAICLFVCPSVCAPHAGILSKRLYIFRHRVATPFQFLSRVTILTRDIDIANLSVCPSVRNVPVSDENGLTYRHSFFTIR